MTLGHLFKKEPFKYPERYDGHYEAMGIGNPYAADTIPKDYHQHMWSKHNYGSGDSHNGHKNNAAMSALTLLAFLFFLNILQQCLNEQMNTMSTPQVMIMSGAKDSQEELLKSHRLNNKMDKVGIVKADMKRTNTIKPKTVKEKTEGIKNNKNERYAPIKLVNDNINQNGKKFVDYNNKDELGFPGYVSAMMKK